MTFYRFIRGIVKVAVKLLFKVEYQGMDKLPEDSGYILCSNHISWVDPVLLAVGIKQQVHFMAKAELFNIPVFGPVLKKLGAFPVERGKGDTGAMDWAADIIKGGKTLAIFPEGTRSKDGKPLRPKSGAALIARVTGADVLPCAIMMEGKLSFRTRITVKFGEIIKNERLGFDDDSPSSLKRASKTIFGGTLKLLGVEQ